MHLIVNLYLESDNRQHEVIVVQKNIPWSTNMASSVWPESMGMWRLPHRTFPSPTTMKRSKVEHFPFNIHTTKHLDRVTKMPHFSPRIHFLLLSMKHLCQVLKAGARGRHLRRRLQQRMLPKADATTSQ